LRFFIFLLAALCATLSADTLDYARRTVVVVGLETGATNPQAVAALSARAREVLRNATYDRNWTVASWLAAHPLAQRRLERVNLDSRRLGTKFLSDGTASTEYEFQLAGPVLNLLLPPTGGGRLLGKTACPTCTQPWPEGRDPGADVTLMPLETGTPVEYTGILIDAKGLAYRPALLPRVVTASDDEVIGPGFARPENLAQAGPAGYFRDRAEALSSERVGANPLVVRALSVTGINSCDFVVSAADAARIHGSKANIDLLSRCKVGLLVD
jgi:hypothetical protein